MVFNRRNYGLKILLLGIILCISCSNISCAAATKYKVPASGGKTYTNTTNTVQGQNQTIETGTEMNVYPSDSAKNYTKNWSVAKQLNVVNRIGNSLRAVSNIPPDRDVTFTVARKYSANAHADFHNNVVVYRGLLNYIENEDELASIIAHELGHVEQKHVKKNIARSVGVLLAGTAVDTIAGTGGLATTSAHYTNLKFTRKDEYKADERGIDLMVLAGYNPLATISILYKIGTNYIEFWQDHPATPKRIFHDYLYIKKKYPQYIDKGFDTTAYKYAYQNIKLKENELNEQHQIEMKSSKSKKKKNTANNSEDDEL